MMSLDSHKITTLLRAYVAVALAVSAVLSPPALSFVPVIMLAWYLYQWRRPVSGFVSLMTEYFMFFAIGLLFTHTLGRYYPPVITLPLLFSCNRALQKTAESLVFHPSAHTRLPTKLYIIILAIALAMLAIGVVMTHLTLLVNGTVTVVYLLTLTIVILRRVPHKPIVENRVKLRVIAGQQGQADVTLMVKSKLCGLFFLESPHDWYRVNPTAFILRQVDKVVLRITVSPMLSGPAEVSLKGYAFDRWGLFMLQFNLEPVELMVVPRAKYAEWMARKYLTGTKAGMLPIISNFGVIKPNYGLRRGVEYYGNRMYQPGDSLKYINWKASCKHNELVVKEFNEVQAQPAIILINLVAGDAEQMDQLSYNILVAAMSLAQENIPSALAVYNHESVVMTTGTLSSQELISHALEVVKRVTVISNPVRYLSPPDVQRLRANANRLRLVESQPAGVLRELMQIEYKSLSSNARANPCTRALAETIGKSSQQSSIVVISVRNHDVEALAFSTFNLMSKGNAVIAI